MYKIIKNIHVVIGSFFLIVLIARYYLQNEFVRFGGVARDLEPLEDVKPGKRIEIKTTKNTYTCDALVLCVGSWVGPVARKLGLKLPVEVRAFSFVSVML